MPPKIKDLLAKATGPIKSRFPKQFESFTAKTGWYWLGTALTIVVGFCLNQYLTEIHPSWEMVPKFIVYNFLNGSERAGLPSDTAVVLITDQEYWAGKNPNWDLAHRSPLKKDYVGKLVEKLCAADARVVALDINLSAPSDNPAVRESEDYADEISKFRNSIKEALEKPDIMHPWRNPLCRIVFGVPLSCQDSHCNVRARQDIQAKDFGSPRVTEGQVNFAPDIRQMPTQVDLANGEDEDSFAIAITHSFNASFDTPSSASKAANAGQASDEDDDEFPFVLFLKERDFETRVLESNTVIVSNCDSASGLGSEDCLAVKRLVQGRVVLVGGGWHLDGEKRGDLIDQYQTPAGTLTGVFIHLNYVAAALDGRVERAVPKWLDWSVDLLIVLIMAVVAAASTKGWTRALALLGFCVFWLIAQYLTWHNLGLFIDCTIPVALLVLHSYVHTTVEAQFKARAAERRGAKESD